jgi:uncharacterized protein
VKKNSNPNSSEREIRLRSTPQRFEIRANADGSRTISGYAATFGDLSQDLGGFVERIQAGAFSKSIRDNDVRCLYSHDDSKILGRVSSGTLQIAEDSKGLHFSCRLPNTSTANEVVALMERGDLSQMSFGFSVVNDDWSPIGDQLVRTLIEVQLWEISVVGDPAYTSTSVSVRSCPVQLRAKLKRDWDDDDPCDPDSDSYDPQNDDCEDRDEECSCNCRACAIDRDCSACIVDNCSADNCDCESARANAETDKLRMRLKLTELRIKHEDDAETEALKSRIELALAKKI